MLLKKQSTEKYLEASSYFIAASLLIIVMTKGLLIALFSGFLTYSVVHAIANKLGSRFEKLHPRFIAVGLVTLSIALSIAVLSFFTANFLKGDAGSVQHVLSRLADMIAESKKQIPQWLGLYLPNGSDELRNFIVLTLRDNAEHAKMFGKEATTAVIHWFIGLVIGSIIAASEVISTTDAKTPQLAFYLKLRSSNFLVSFQRIAFSQLRISAINTAITAIFIFIVLPSFGVHLPLSTTLVVITFLAGIIPVIGNLISNTMLVVVALSQSLYIAIAAIVFMMIIHKLEYFLNAKIIGDSIQAKAWELILAMLIMESIFGIAGAIAAPVFYAYMKKELMDKELI